MKIERFEDIRAWQQARELANLVYDLTEQGNFARDFRLRDQIRDAASSIMHNIAEDFQRVYDLATTTKKSINAFIAYSRKSKRGLDKSA